MNKYSPSMKSILDTMTKNEKMALARLFETNEYKILKKYMEATRVTAATLALNAQNWEEVKHLQGQAHSIKMLHLNLKENHKQSVKD